MSGTKNGSNEHSESSGSGIRLDAASAGSAAGSRIKLAAGKMDAQEAAVEAVVKMLRRSDCFRGLSPLLLREIAQLSEIRIYQARDEIFRVGDPGDYLYGVLSGRLRIYVASAQGRELSLSTTEVGDIGGEISVLDGGTRTTNGRAIMRSVLAIIPRDQFHALLLKRPEISVHMLKFLCKRVRQTSEQVEDVAFLSAAQRLAKQLHILVANVGHPLPVKLRISQSDLAGYLNATRQVVNTILREWQREGFIELSRGSIEVINLEGIFAALERVD